MCPPLASASILMTPGAHTVRAHPGVPPLPSIKARARRFSLPIAVADTHHGHQHGLLREDLPDINTAQQGQWQSVHQMARRRFQVPATVDKHDVVRGQPIAERAQRDLLQAIGNDDQATASLLVKSLLDMR